MTTLAEGHRTVLLMTTVQAVDAADVGWESERPVKWWVLLISGIAWILIGAVVLDFDLDSAAAIGYLIGGFLIAGGITEFVLIGVTDGWHWLHATLGVLLVLTGVAAFFEPVQTFGILAHMLGFLLVLKGTCDLVVAIAGREVSDLWWMMLVAGILEIVLGFWASGYPGRSSQLLILWVGIGALIRGVTHLVMAFGVRKVDRGLA